MASKPCAEDARAIFRRRGKGFGGRGLFDALAVARLAGGFQRVDLAARFCKVVVGCLQLDAKIVVVGL